MPPSFARVDARHEARAVRVFSAALNAPFAHARPHPGLGRHATWRNPTPVSSTVANECRRFLVNATSRASKTSIAEEAGWSRGGTLGGIEQAGLAISTHMSGPVPPTTWSLEIARRCLVSIAQRAPRDHPVFPAMELSRRDSWRSQGTAALTSPLI